ncbi:MAG: DNA repair protein RecO [Xanthomonadales bacterium]|nr:DNA repair protein RecO [Xanthomonadales bacterium]
MRISLEPSYVLHGRAYQESSLLLEVFAREHGRLGLVARGARGGRSRWKNMLQPFRPLLLSWNQRGELGTLTGADQVASPPALTGESLFCGLYANELLMRFLQRGDPHPDLFERYREMLTALAAGRSTQPVLRVFECRLLDAAGFGLQLDHEADSGELLSADAWYLYLPERGPVRRDLAENRDGLVSGAALLALKSGEPAASHLPELKALMRRLIRHHLGDRALKSQQLFV